MDQQPLNWLMTALQENAWELDCLFHLCRYRWENLGFHNKTSWSPEMPSCASWMKTGVPLESGRGWSMFLRDGWSGICHGDRFMGGTIRGLQTWVSESGLPPLSSNLAEKTQKDKWDELIASSIIPLAAAGMFWNYRFFFFFLKICSSLWFSPFYELIFSSWIISRIRQE